MSRNQRHALDAKLREAPRPPGPLPVDRMRAGFAAFMGAFPVPADVRRTPTELAGRPAVLVEPEGDAQPGTILYFHGGSFSFGSPETAMVLTANLVRRTRVRAISLDYRLAPEHPFPAAIDDCVAAFRSLLDSDIDPASTVFAGDSAGGGLAVTTCLAARDAGLPMPAAIAAFSPGLDHTRSGATMSTKEGVDSFFTAEGMRRTGEMYLGGQDPNQPLLAPRCPRGPERTPADPAPGRHERIAPRRLRAAGRARTRSWRRRDSRRHRRGAARVPGVRRHARRSGSGTRPGSPVPHPTSPRSPAKRTRRDSGPDGR
jgi:epsilon-lactone hydrolase